MKYQERCLPWKDKGEYPVDDEGVLLISPYCKKALALAEKRRKKKVYPVDVIIVSTLITMAYYLVKIVMKKWYL